MVVYWAMFFVFAVEEMLKEHQLFCLKKKNMTLKTVW